MFGSGKRLDERRPQSLQRRNAGRSQVTLRSESARRSRGSNFYASRFDANGRLQVSTRARSDVVKLQRKLNAITFLDISSREPIDTQRGRCADSVGAVEKTRKDWWRPEDRTSSLTRQKI